MLTVYDEVCKFLRDLKSDITLSKKRANLLQVGQQYFRLNIIEIRGLCSRTGEKRKNCAKSLNNVTEYPINDEDISKYKVACCYCGFLSFELMLDDSNAM